MEFFSLATSQRSQRKGRRLLLGALLWKTYPWTMTTQRTSGTVRHFWYLGYKDTKFTQQQRSFPHYRISHYWVWFSFSTRCHFFFHDGDENSRKNDTFLEPSARLINWLQFQWLWRGGNIADLSLITTSMGSFPPLRLTKCFRDWQVKTATDTVTAW